MRQTLRYLLTISVGLILGVLAAIHAVRAGSLGSNVAIGPWQTGRDFGTADASARTRAVVALRGLLALPAKEARYYTASTDDAGQPLDGRCRYRVSGVPLPGKWWSLTLYDNDGYLAGPGPYSVEGATVLSVTAAERRRAQAAPNYIPMDYIPDARRGPYGWDVFVGPKPSRLPSLSTASLARFQLTLRLYLPNDGGRGDPPRAALPSIVKEGC